MVALMNNVPYTYNVYIDNKTLHYARQNESKETAQSTGITPQAIQVHGAVESSHKALLSRRLPS